MRVQQDSPKIARQYNNCPANIIKYMTMPTLRASHPPNPLGAMLCTQLTVLSLNNGGRKTVTMVMATGTQEVNEV